MRQDFEVQSVHRAEKSAREEAGGSTCYRARGQTLKSRNPMRVAARRPKIGRTCVYGVLGGSNPLKRPALGESKAPGRAAKRQHPDGERCGRSSLRTDQGSREGARKSQEGKAGREVTPLPEGGGTLKGEPQECCRGSGGVLDQVARGARRPSRRNGTGAIGRGWNPGAAEGRATAQVPSVGRFELLASAEGEEKPMRGGVCGGLSGRARRAYPTRLHTDRYGSRAEGEGSSPRAEA